MSSNKCKRKNAKGGQTNGDIRYILWAGINLLTTTYNVIIMEEINEKTTMLLATRWNHWIFIRA